MKPAVNIGKSRAVHAHASPRTAQLTWSPRAAPTSVSTSAPWSGDSGLKAPEKRFAALAATRRATFGREGQARLHRAASAAGCEPIGLPLPRLSPASDRYSVLLALKRMRRSASWLLIVRSGSSCVLPPTALSPGEGREDVLECLIEAGRSRSWIRPASIWFSSPAGRSGQSRRLGAAHPSTHSTTRRGLSTSTIRFKTSTGLRPKAAARRWSQA
ncbi:MAG: hypothetical protein JWN91_3376 [Nocardioides sp.]|nr:hypothetical protein [Nocardioides sp.]